jgi:hypothetical protein
MTIKKYFECDCFSIEHVFRISYLSDEPEEMYLEPHLSNTDGIIERVLTAIRYIFGHRSVYGDFDSVVLNIKKAKELHRCLGNFIEENKKYEETKQKDAGVSGDSSG